MHILETPGLWHLLRVKLVVPELKLLISRYALMFKPIKWDSNENKYNQKIFIKVLVSLLIWTGYEINKFNRDCLKVVVFSIDTK